MIPIRIFISSVQQEFANERKALAEYIRTDALLGRFFNVFIFEEMPATSQSAVQVYLGEVEQSDIYLALMGSRYGYEDSEGISPTEREFDLATNLHKDRLIFIKRMDSDQRNVKDSHKNASTSERNALTPTIKLNKKQKMVLEYCHTYPKSSNEIFQYLGIVNQSRSREKYINSLILAGLLRPTKSKSNDPDQKYIATAEYESD